MILIVSFALWLLCGIIKDEVVLDIGNSIFYVFYNHYNTQCGKMKDLLSPKKYFVKSTRYLVISLVKMLLSRNFYQKSVRVNFRFYHTVLW